MHGRFLLALFLIFSSLSLKAQTEEEAAFAREFLYGINFNSNAGLIGGFCLKWSREVKPRHWQTYGLELAHVKHPKEYKARAGSNTYIQFKTHYFFALRPYYARRFVLFEKASEDGVRVSLIAGAGPTLGIRKPYHVLYRETGSQDVTSVPFTPDLTLNNIDGVGPFYDGFDRLQYIPGIHGRLAASFDFGFMQTSVSNLELGITLEKFTKRVDILAETTNFSGFNAVYFTLFFGRRY